MASVTTSPRHKASNSAEQFENGDVLVTLLPVNEKFPWVTPAKFRPELVPEELMAPSLSVSKIFQLFLVKYFNSIHSIKIFFVVDSWGVREQSWETDNRHQIYHVHNILQEDSRDMDLHSLHDSPGHIVRWSDWVDTVWSWGGLVDLQCSGNIFLYVGEIEAEQEPGEMCGQCQRWTHQTQSNIGSGWSRKSLVPQSQPLLHLHEQYSVHCKYQDILLLYLSLIFKGTVGENSQWKARWTGSERSSVWQRSLSQKCWRVWGCWGWWRMKMNDQSIIWIVQVVVAGRNSVSVGKKGERAQKLFLHYAQRWSKDYLRRRLDWVIDDVCGRQDYSSNTSPRHVKGALCPCQV